MYTILVFLNECAKYYKNKIKKFIFLHVSTDEVYGSAKSKRKIIYRTKQIFT